MSWIAKLAECIGMYYMAFALVFVVCLWRGDRWVRKEIERAKLGLAGRRLGEARKKLS